MSENASLLTFIFDAGPLVKFVMMILILASIVSWAFIIQRAFFFRDTRRQSQHFEDQFWSGGDLNELFEKLKRHPQELSGLQGLFFAGFEAFLRIRQKTNVSPQAIMEGVQRAMRIADAREQDKLEKHLPFLATVGSTSPYVGLFGTVWGIMTSFQALAGQSQQATIAMVAPGISEALIATAMGLFAAIPAVIAYNRFNSDFERISNTYNTFQEEFIALLSRQISH
ncbi:MAG: protein TolQ [Gammaproteobacteria bacterium]|nr:protein TolQ [Gammaproteobacteria bacterium]